MTNTCCCNNCGIDFKSDLLAPTCDNCLVYLGGMANLEQLRDIICDLVYDYGLQGEEGDWKEHETIKKVSAANYKYLGNIASSHTKITASAFAARHFCSNYLLGNYNEEEYVFELYQKIKTSDLSIIREGAIYGAFDAKKKKELEYFLHDVYEHNVLSAKEYLKELVGESYDAHSPY